MQISNSELRQMALAEYGSDVTTAHHGFVTGGSFWNATFPNHNGQKSRPFWNVHATQFMFNPCFEFAAVPRCSRFLFTATDCCKKVHTFEAESPMSLLTPIWNDLPEGYVELKVEALNDDGTPWTLVGARSFYKCAPYEGPDAYPAKARSYRECALMAYRFVFNTPSVQHWLKYGIPDPNYDLNIYPSKMITAIILAMVSYASLDPENAENALQLARNAADFLLSITFCSDSALAGLPPTYYSRYKTVGEGERNPLDVIIREGGSLERLVMMCYPAGVGSAYLALEKATGDTKYYDAARTIAEFYRANVLENGTWPLMMDIITGESRSTNDLMPDSVIPFMKAMYDRTGEEIWLNIMKNAHAYRVRCRMETYEWEGQFEDSPTSAHYSNLSHYPADAMVFYIAENQKDDPEAMAQAEDLMRFIEDQFVVWKNFSPRNRHGYDGWFSTIPEWNSPAGLEQYNWYVPIDASTSHIMIAFLRLYKANGNPLLLAKACTLADSITRMQNPRTGMIPTHWMNKQAIEDGGGLWMNCVIETAGLMLEIANATEGCEN